MSWLAVAFALSWFAALVVTAVRRAARPLPWAAFAVVFGLTFAVAGCGRSEFEDEFEPGFDLDSGPGTDADVGPDFGPDTPDTPGDCSVRVEALSIDPGGASTPVGSSVFFRARALCPDGFTQDVTAWASWTSNNPSVAQVTSPGAVSALRAGFATIRASYLGATATASVTVTGDTLIDLRIDPPFADLTVGGAQKFSATAFYSSGASSDVTTSASWRSDSPSIASVSSSGVVTGIAGGSTGIAATFGGRTAYAKVSVSGRTLAALEVSPLFPSIGVGSAVAMRATALYTDGSKADVTGVSTWVSSDPSIADVALTGPIATVRGVAPGTANIQAFFGGMIAATPVTVSAGKITSVVVTPSTATIAIGTSATLKATASYSDGSSVDVTASAFWKSSNEGVASVGGGGVKGAAAGTATITASFGGLSGAATVTVSPAKLISIVVEPGSVTAPLGSKVALKARGTYEGGGTRDITNDVTWSIDALSNAAGSKGEITPVAVGTTTARAKLDGLEGKAVVVVTAAGITKIAITPNPLTMVAGTKQLAKATATYADGATVDVTTTCTWTTGDAKIATVSNGAGSQGQVAAIAAGTTTLSCTQAGVTGTATINVSGATVEQVTVSPLAPTCRIGDILQFQSTAISTGGTSRNVTTTSTWSSSAPTIVQYLGTPGRFRCLAKGTATVSASFSGKTGSAPVTVTDAVVVSISVDPVGLTLAAGTFQQYQATALFSDGTSRNVTVDPGTTWSSTNPAVASVNNVANKGRVAALSAGTTAIRATYSGVTGSTTLNVSAATVVAVQISPPAPNVPAGVSFDFTATAIYSDGTSRDVTGAATWSSSNSGVIAVSNAAGSKGDATTFAAGSAKVSATYSGVTGSASVNVTTATLTKIQLTPFNPKLPVGFGIRLTATGVWSDGFTANVTGQATWTSSNAGVASVSSAVGSKGRVTPITAGTATISATYNGVTGSTLVTVSSATLTAIAITPNPATLSVGGSLQLTATGSFSDGSTLDVTDYVGWGSNDATVADVSNATDSKGVAYGFKAGTVTIRGPPRPRG
ncbi:MAG: Ig-like domain-containing protein [Deltaproteobacteria bacterium]|nr:Ig-like domain-containing protein [Deltaproteobacteria bacterium]